LNIAARDRKNSADTSTTPKQQDFDYSQKKWVENAIWHRSAGIFVFREKTSEVCEHAASHPGNRSSLCLRADTDRRRKQPYERKVL
jgi:hypothetical protein